MILPTFLFAACTKRLPPAPTPAQVTPPVDTGAPRAAGEGRVVIDVVDGSSSVHLVRMEALPMHGSQGRVTYHFVERSEILCQATPCVADLPRGNRLLGFPILGGDGELEVDLVHVGREPSVYRRSLSKRGDSGPLYVLGIVGTSVGSASMVTGTALLPVGLKDGNDGLTLAGAITLGAGAALVTLGILWINGDAPTYRPGSSAHFPLGGAIPLGE